MDNNYFKVENFTEENEALLTKAGRAVRNYGHLKQSWLEGIAKAELQDANPKELLRRDKPWRLKRFISDLISTRGSTYGVATYDNLTLRVMDGGIAGVLGKGSTQASEEEAEDLEVQVDFAPWDNTDKFWRKFAFHRELLSGSLINILPDRPFALYVYAKDSVGDDAPIFYMELQIKNAVERHSVVWELDQMLATTRRRGRPHEASFASEYASGYHKLYFFVNWEEMAPRRIDRAVVSDLPKEAKRNWDVWLADQHENRWFDAALAIMIIALSTWLSIESGRFSISLVAGIAVAGIAAEEWSSPLTILLGAVGRFYAHESLALRMYYRTDLAMSTKRVIISLLASAGEIADYIATQTGLDETYIFGLSGQDVILIAFSAANIICLLPTTYPGVYGAFSHSDMPSSSSYFPKIYVSRGGYMRQIVDDLRPVEEYCSVYRPLLHWQRGASKRFLGNEIDLGAPGAPPSMVCYWLSTPASASIAISRIYGHWDVNPFLLVVCFLEQLMAILGALLVIVLDIPVIVVMLVNLLLKKLHLSNRHTVLWLNTLALALYSPAQLFLGVVNAANHCTASMLGLDVLDCRARSTARLHRLPLIQRVRTGRSSNHAWKFGDHIVGGYYRCSDQIIVNPRVNKLGMLPPGKLFFKRHKLLWNSTEGVRYATPVLACGDNTISRRTSFVGQTKAPAGRGVLKQEEISMQYGFELPVGLLNKSSGRRHGGVRDSETRLGSHVLSPESHASDFSGDL